MTAAWKRVAAALAIACAAVGAAAAAPEGAP